MINFGRWSWRLWIVPPVAIGIAAIVLAPMIKKPPQKSPAVERAVPARVITLKEMDIRPRAIGYGNTKSGKTWEAVAEVAGQVIFVSEKLKDGHFVETGEELLRIDDAAYQLAVVQQEALLNASVVKERTTRSSLVIAEKNLSLLRKDLARQQELAARGTTSKAVLETTERAVLIGEATVQNHRNTVAINLAERRVILAQKANTELDLRHTIIRAPFNVRVTDVKINRAQYANRGQVLLLADGMEVAEVTAQFPIGKLRPLIGASQSQGVSVEGVAEPGALGLEAIVRLRTSTHQVEWKARIDRVSGSVNTQTQTLGIVVAVDAPYSKAAPGERPPLTRNSFVEVELIGKPQKSGIAIPAGAIHEGKIYVLDDENRLVIRSAEVRFIQGSLAVLSSGVKPGERVVISDLIPAIQGMLINPKEDPKAKKLLEFEATGRSAKQ